MSHRIARPGRVVVLTALAVAGPLAGSAGAAIEVFRRTGTQTFTVPAGVTSLTVEAVGGRGGSLGGYGARVRGAVSVSPGDALIVQVAGNGTVGLGGSGGGGAVPFGSFAGGGGGASLVSRGGASLVAAAGGGGSGGDSLPGDPGDGGDAGAAGRSGYVGMLTVVAGGGGGGAGQTAAAGTPGQAGPSPQGGCVGGAPGASDAGAGQGGTGGLSADPFGFGDGGGGGGGVYGGGGGGSGGYCAADDTGHGGGGGGGGSSLVPVSGSFVLDSTGVPGVTLTWTDPVRRLVLPALSVSISSPRDGASYAQGQVIRASYSCSAKIVLTSDSCIGPVPSGSSIDTSTVGTRTFTVVGTRASGERTERTVSYTVVDRAAPAVSALRLGGGRLDLGQPRAFIGVGFSLSEPGRVVVRLFRGRARRPARVLRLGGRAGRNSFRLRARAGRRTLRPGGYRLVLVATDAAGNRSRPLTRSFSVVE